MNVNELKEKLAALNKRTQKPMDLWKPKDEHEVRLVRDPHDDEPMQQRSFHYNIGDVISILCPKANFGEECPICDFGDVLRNWNRPDGSKKPDQERKDDFEVFKKIQAVAKVFVPMVERLDPKDPSKISEPKWWGMTGPQASQVLEVCTDPDRLGACDLDPEDASKALDAVFGTKKAFDLKVSFAKPGEKGNNKSFTMISIKSKYKPSPLTGSPALDKEIVSKIKPLSEVFKRVSTQEVESALKKFVNGGMQESKPEGGAEKYTDKPTNSTEDAKKVGTRSVDDAFAELAGEK
jgi:hypothetical protein